MNRHKRHTAAWRILGRILILIDAALLEKSEKAVEQALDVFIEMFRGQDIDVVEILILTEQLRKDR